MTTGNVSDGVSAPGVSVKPGRWKLFTHWALEWTGGTQIGTVHLSDGGDQTWFSRKHKFFDVRAEQLNEKPGVLTQSQSNVEMHRDHGENEENS